MCEREVDEVLGFFSLMLKKKKNQAYCPIQALSQGLLGVNLILPLDCLKRGGLCVNFFWTSKYLILVGMYQSE